MHIDDWKGYQRINFTVGERQSFLVRPKEAQPGRPWIWRAEFPGAFDQADMALLEAGWHLAYHCVSDRYGCPSSIDDMKEFFDTVVPAFDLHPKTVLFGFSRGGLYACNYALRHPEDVAALYLDAPVLDIRSWPGGLGAGLGEPGCWEECRRCYELDTEEKVESFFDNPLDNAERLAQLNIPIMLVAGDSDVYVPYSENGELFSERFEEAGGRITVIVKAGCNHHPHSLEDPAPIQEFLEIFTGFKAFAVPFGSRHHKEHHR